MKLPNTIISLILNKNDEKEWEKLYFLFQDEIEWKINHNKIMNIDISKFIKSIKLIIVGDFIVDGKEYILNENDNIINYCYGECIKYFRLILKFIDTKLNKENGYSEYNICNFEKINKFYFSERVNFDKRYYFKIKFFIKYKNEIFKSIKYEIKKDLRSLKKNPRLYRYDDYYNLNPEDLKEQKDLIDKYGIIYDIYEEKYDHKDKGKLFLVSKELCRNLSTELYEYTMDIISEVDESDNIKIIKKFIKILNGKYYHTEMQQIGDTKLFFKGNPFLYIKWNTKNKFYYKNMIKMISDYYNSIAEQSAIDFIKTFN